MPGRKSGHQSTECPEPRSAEGVECKRCEQSKAFWYSISAVYTENFLVGHFAKDCPNFSNACRNCGEEGHKSAECDKPKNPAMSKCRNCDQMGHFSKDCPEPKDWSKVKCNNCGEMGHTIKRCKQPVAEDGDGEGEGYNNDANGDTAAGNGGWGASQDVQPSADWNTAPEEVSAW